MGNGCRAGAASDPLKAGAASDPLKETRKRAEGLIQVSDLRNDGATTGFPIAKTEDRAITLAQLQRLVDYIEGHCKSEGWTSCNPAKPGAELEPQSIDLYNVVFWVVKPATKKDKCSYVELVATSAQEPTWFVSHWWGEPVVKFVACLRGHTRDRDLPPTVCYWVCAYANNQWQAGAEVGEDPAQSSFRRAIDKSVGTVTILDESATTYTRIWCSYEIFVTLVVAASGVKQYLYDVYAATSDGSNAHGLTDGFAAVDYDDTELKSIREAYFPMHLLQKGLDSNIVEAQASLPADRVHILNAIVGNSDLNETPPETHDRYDDLNDNLRASFAVRLLRCVEQEGVADKCQNAMRKSRTQDMSLGLEGSKREQLVLGVVQNGLPDSLRTLSILWECCSLGPALGTGIASAIQPLNGLTALNLDLRGSELGVEGGIAVGNAVCSLRSLERLLLDLSGCGMGDAAGLSILSSLGSLERLQDLNVDFGGNSQEDEKLAPGVVHNGLPESLRTLSIAWRFSSLGPALGTGIASAIHPLNGLTKLRLNFVGSNIAAEGGIALDNAFGNLGHLEDCTLYLDKCGLGKARALHILSSLRRWEGLKTLKLWMPHNGLDDEVAQAVAPAMRAMPMLQEVTLQLLYGNNFGDPGKQALKDLAEELRGRRVSVEID